MSLWQIKSLPVPQLLAPGALVGIWVTNKQKYLRFTKSELFPHWSIELVAEWYWVKVTRRGELVTNLDSPHKKPYEPLLIGQFRPKINCVKTASLSLIKDSKSDEEKKESCSRQSKFCNESSPQMKRKRIIECDVKYCICDAGKSITSATRDGKLSTSKSVAVIDLNQSECSKKNNAQLHNFLQTVATQDSSKHLNCEQVFHKNEVDLSDKMKNLSDVNDQVKKEKTSQEFAQLHVDKWVCNTGTDLRLEKNDRETKVPKRLDSRDSVVEEYDVLPYHQVICSVPCRIHSKKPPLNGEYR